jgi:hypothetical protein
MAEDRFDALVRQAAAATSRRQLLRGLIAGVGGALFALAGARPAHADPRICVTCICGVGRPCNQKSGGLCTETRGFPEEQTCQEACARHNQHLCSAGIAYHCPKGCPD